MLSLSGMTLIRLTNRDLELLKNACKMVVLHDILCSEVTKMFYNQLCHTSHVLCTDSCCMSNCLLDASVSSLTSLRIVLSLLVELKKHLIVQLH